MRSSTLSAAMALAACASAAPVNQAIANQTSFANNLSAYTMGFIDSSIDSSLGGHAICISGMVDVMASANIVHINCQEPADQIAVTELLVENFQDQFNAFRAARRQPEQRQRNSWHILAALLPERHD
jgi:hypothetical protein